MKLCVNCKGRPSFRRLLLRFFGQALQHPPELDGFAHDPDSIAGPGGDQHVGDREEDDIAAGHRNQSTRLHAIFTFVRTIAAMRRVLIVDDDPKVCETLDRYLAHAGFAPASALDGRRALDAVRAFAPDLIVLDVMLPELDGLALCREIRAVSNVPIIFLTARSTERDKLAGLALGADDYLTKPFSPRELVARVQAVLRRAAAGEAA